MLQTINNTLVSAGKTKSLPRNSKYRLIIAETVDRIEELRPFCQTLRQSAGEVHPNCDIDRFLSLLGDAQPYLMLLIRDGRPQAMLLGKKKTIITTCKIGYLDLFRPSLKGLSIVYRGFLGRQTQEVCRTFLGHLTRILRDGDCDMVEFEYLPIDSLMYKLATTIPKTLTRGHFPKADSHWGISVPRNIDIFYNRLSKKHRYNLQRSMRLLEDQHSVRVQTYRSQDNLEEAIALAAEISPKTYQHAFGWGFVDDDNTRTCAWLSWQGSIGSVFISFSSMINPVPSSLASSTREPILRSKEALMPI